MQTALFIDYEDYSDDKVLIGLSGGINSMAVLCWLADYPEEYKPKELHLFYAHFDEHSPDTEDFCKAGVEFAKKNFETVIYKQLNNSLIDFFKDQKMIPHPMVSPCTRVLKIMPIHEYMANQDIKVDLVGYVRDETRRIKRMAEKTNSEITNVVTEEGVTKKFPIHDKSNEWCFDIVKSKIGWYPKIYDIKDSKNNRVFKHNNCLPCKNMNQKDFLLVKEHFPEYWLKAVQLSEELQGYWGRDKKGFATAFGEAQTPDGSQDCVICAFD